MHNSTKEATNSDLLTSIKKAIKSLFKHSLLAMTRVKENSFYANLYFQQNFTRKYLNQKFKSQEINYLYHYYHYYYHSLRLLFLKKIPQFVRNNAITYYQMI